MKKHYSPLPPPGRHRTPRSPRVMDGQIFRQQLNPIERWDRQFNIDWGFPPDHESAC